MESPIQPIAERHGEVTPVTRLVGRLTPFRDVVSSSVTLLVGRVTPSRGVGDFVSLPTNQVTPTNQSCHRSHWGRGVRGVAKGLISKVSHKYTS